MKITQSWKRNTPTTDGYGLTVTYVYSSKYLHEIEALEKKLTNGIIVMDTDRPKELVRCKDCIKVDVCCRRGTDNPDWFCADGERK